MMPAMMMAAVVVVVTRTRMGNTSTTIRAIKGTRMDIK